MYFIAVVLAAGLSQWAVEGKVETDKQTGSGTISFGQDLNDEYDHSIHMPDVLKCDACRVIAYQLTKSFKAHHDKRPSTKKFEESDVIDITDGVCEQMWDGYGIKHMDNVKRLSGEGLETEKLPGVTQAGGKLPERLREVCLTYMGDLGEMDIYTRYLNGEQLEAFLCKGSGLRSYCVKNEGKTTGKKDERQTMKHEL